MKLLNKKMSWMVLLVLAACSKGPDPKTAMPPNGPPPAEVNVRKVVYESANITQDLPGRLQAVRSAQVRARVEGVVEKRFFVEGTDVNAGAPLFQIDTRTYKLAADAARSDAAAARLVAERSRALLELNAVSQQEMDAALARQKQAESALAKANLDYENAMVPAPISGRIGHALVTEGALVGRGESTPLAVIEQLDPIYVNFSQSETEVFALRQLLKRGQVSQTNQARVQLLLPDGSVYSKEGRLTFSDQAVDPNTGAVLLRAEFPNPNRELLPGSFVRIRLPQAKMDKAIRVPQRAVQMSSSGANVLTVNAEGKVQVQPVKVGPMSGDQWIITDGLTEGMQVVVDGLQKAKPGAMVKPVDLDAPKPAAAASAASPAAPASAPKQGG